MGPEPDRWRAEHAQKPEAPSTTSRGLHHDNPMAYVVDHILPLSAGGPDTIDNKQPAHRVCNRQKSDKVSGISTSQAMRMPFVRDSTFAE